MFRNWQPKYRSINELSRAENRRPDPSPMTLHDRRDKCLTRLWRESAPTKSLDAHRRNHFDACANKNSIRPRQPAPMPNTTPSSVPVKSMRIPRIPIAQPTTDVVRFTVAARATAAALAGAPASHRAWEARCAFSRKKAWSSIVFSASFHRFVVGGRTWSVPLTRPASIHCPSSAKESSYSPSAIRMRHASGALVSFFAIGSRASSSYLDT